MILKKDITGYQVGREKFATYREAWLRSQASGKPIQTLGPRKIWSAHYREYVGIVEDDE